MRMRTQAEVMKHIKAQDPDTALTAWAVRTMVLTGRIPSVKVGRVRLIDLDTLDLYLSPAPEPAPETEPGYGTIRPISVAK